jgi:hypothetical protein
MSGERTLGLARRETAAPAGRAWRAMSGTMGTLCVLVAAYALLLLAVPTLRPPLMQQRFAEYPWSTALHLAAGSLVILLAPVQWSARVRSRHAALHRWSGRVYALGVLLAGLAGLSLATISQGGVPAHLGFGLLSMLWMATTAVGVQRILAGDQEGHRRWMVRSIALTLAAVTLRIYIPLGVVLGLPVEPSYQVIAWLCWVPNLLVAEWRLRRGRSAERAGRFAARALVAP